MAVDGEDLMEESKPLQEENDTKPVDGGASNKLPALSCEKKSGVEKCSKNTYEPKLWLALAKTYWVAFLIGAFFKLGHDILLFASPLLLK